MENLKIFIKYTKLFFGIGLLSIVVFFALYSFEGLNTYCEAETETTLYMDNFTGYSGSRIEVEYQMGLERNFLGLSGDYSEIEHEIMHYQCEWDIF